MTRLTSRWIQNYRRIQQDELPDHVGGECSECGDMECAEGETLCPKCLPRVCIGCNDAFAQRHDEYCSSCLGAVEEDEHDAKKERRRTED